MENVIVWGKWTSNDSESKSDSEKLDSESGDLLEGL